MSNTLNQDLKSTKTFLLTFLIFFREKVLSYTLSNHFIFAFLILSFSVSSQSLENITFQNITTKDGLSSSSVHQIIQDNKGFLWAATFNGLSRFDGVNFQVFKSEKENPNTIAGNHIRAIHWDNHGYLWVGTLKNGISRYNPKTGKFKQFISQKEDKNTLTNNQILCFYEDKNGQLWIGTENGLNLFDYEKETFQQFTASDEAGSLSANAVLSINEDARGWLWIGLWDGGLNLAIPTDDDRKYKFRHFEADEANPTSLITNHPWATFNDDAGRFWVSSFTGGLCLMLPNEETNPELFEPQFIHFKKEGDLLEQGELTDNTIFAINQDKDHRIWVSTANGISIFQPDDYFANIEQINPNQANTIPKVYFHYLQHNSNKPTSLPDNEVRNVFFDKNNIAWCATLNGIGKFDPNSLRFTHYMKPSYEQGNIFIGSLQEYDENTVFVGTRSDFGLVEYNPQTNRMTKYYTHQPNNKNSLGENDIFSIYKINEDTLLLGTRNFISVFLPKQNKFINHPIILENGQRASYVNPKKILKDSKNQYWIASVYGLIHFQPKTGKSKIYTKSEALPFPKSPNLNDLVEDKNGNLWLASFEGLHKLKFNTNDQHQLTSYLHDENNPNSICNNRIIRLALDGNDNLWIGTEDGLALYKAKEDNFKNFTSRNGLKYPSIMSIEIDNNDNLWASTREGIFLLETENETIRYFDVKDGLQNNSFNYTASSKGESGQLYFGGVNGYNAFLGEKVSLIKTPPPVYITNFKTFDQFKDVGTDYTNLEEITLSYRESFFTIEFSALSFTQAEENQYAYMLEGFDKDWIYTGTRNFASYTNLDGGTYTFRVKAANNDGFWNEAGTTLIITIQPPYWNTWWFRLLIALLLIGSALLFYRNRVERIKKRQLILEQEVAHRTKELADSNKEIASQKKEIEMLVSELQSQNETLEKKVEKRTKHLEIINNDLARSNKDLEQFAYIASHDLQEPLRMVGNFVQLLEFRYAKKLDNDGKDYIKFAVEGVQRMSNLIRSLLNYSKVGRSDATFTQANLNEVLQNKLDDLSLFIKRKQAEIQVGNLPKEVLCEPEQIGIVFYNLIYNGIKFNDKEQPQVEVRLDYEDEAHYTFAVKDNGIGIEKDYHDRIFEIFKRLNNRNDFEGNGIGLAVCKRIVSRHDGKIWFESTKGVETTFYFTISKSPKVNPLLQ